jgi:hypothetical protein
MSKKRIHMGILQNRNIPTRRTTAPVFTKALGESPERQTPGPLPVLRTTDELPNYQSLWRFFREVRRIWRKWLSRRTRGNGMTWERYVAILRKHPLLVPRSLHSWHGAGVTPEEPAAVILHGGACEGERRRCYGEPKRARSWKRRKEPRTTYSLSRFPLLGRKGRKQIGSA